MSRQEFSKATKLAAFQRCNGRCEQCTALLYPGKFEFHHLKECTYDGQAELSNCLCLCVACHSAVTRVRAPMIVKSNRVRNKYLGFTRPKQTIPGRRFDGTPIPSRWR